MSTLTAIPKREAFWPATLALIVLVLTSLPYLAGARAQTAGRVFSGAVFARGDYSVHLAAIQAGMRGEWAYRLQFTAEDIPAASVKLTYVLLGHLGGWLGLSPQATFQLARLLFWCLCCLAVFVFFREVFPQPFERRLAFALAVTGSGLGVWQMLAGWTPTPQVSPIDFWLVDPYLFFGALAFPHFSLASAALAGAFALYLRELRKPDWRYWACMAACCMVIQVVQPLLLGLAGLCIAGHFFLIGQWKRMTLIGFLARAGALLLTQLPYLVYQVVVFSRDADWALFTRQNITLSPPIIYYVLGFGFFWLFVFLALGSLWKRVGLHPGGDEPNSSGILLSWVWVVVGLALAYAPVASQRRFTHALVVPLGALAATGFSAHFLPWAERKGLGWLAARRGSLALLLVLLTSISSMYLSLGTAMFLVQGPDAYFETGEIGRAAGWLHQNAGVDEVVLACELTSQYLAANAGVRVYSGHPIETLDYPAKTARVDGFFRGEIGLADLAAPNLHWVVIGPRERQIGVPFIDDRSLTLRYTDGDVEIFEVTP